MACHSSRTFCHKVIKSYLNLFPFHIFTISSDREFHNLITYLWRKYLLVLKLLHDFIQYIIILTLQEQIKMLPFLQYLSVITPLAQPQSSLFQGEITEHFNWSSTRNTPLSAIVLCSPFSSSGNFYHSCLNIQDNNAT